MLSAFAFEMDRKESEAIQEGLAIYPLLKYLIPDVAFTFDLA
jgi:hypothetical protein